MPESEDASSAIKDVLWIRGNKTREPVQGRSRLPLRRGGGDLSILLFFFFFAVLTTSPLNFKVKIEWGSGGVELTQQLQGRRHDL